MPPAGAAAAAGAAAPSGVSFGGDSFVGAGSLCESSSFGSSFFSCGVSSFGGSFAAAERRSYNAYTGCGPTPANMTAILVSAVTSYAGVGGGILSMMLPGAMPPLTNVFYSGYVPVTTVVPVNGASPGGLFDVQISGVSGAALIVEVIGYFAAPVATALDCYVTPAESVSIAAGRLLSIRSAICDVEL